MSSFISWLAVCLFGDGLNIGWFCEIIYATNIILLGIVREDDIFKCFHTSGLNGLLIYIASFVLIINHLLMHFNGFS